MKQIRLLFIWVLLFIAASARAQRLKVKFSELDARGLSLISYNGNTLLDVQKGIGGLGIADAYYKIPKGGKTEALWSHELGKSWNSRSQTRTIRYGWGQIDTRYVVDNDTLQLYITLTNSMQKDTFVGVSFGALTLHLGQQRPTGFVPNQYYIGDNRMSPVFVVASTPKYKLIVESPDLDKKVHVGLVDQNPPKGTLYRLWSGNVPFNGMQNFNWQSALKLLPGKSYSYRISLKFCRPDADVAGAIRDNVTRFNRQKPILLNWPDRRPVGALFLASYKTPTTFNQRNWVFSEKGRREKLDEAGFQQDLLAYADRSIENLRAMGAQGMITWDIEGQQFPHPLSYIGDPEKMALLAPEMTRVADAYFQRFRAAGLRTGICIRPDTIVYNAAKDWIERKAVGDPAATLIRKIKYAKKRWGCVLFYIDSNVDEKVRLMPAAIIEAVARAVPDVLLIPEHENDAYFRFSAPYAELRQGITVIPENVRVLSPKSFMVLNIADTESKFSKDQLMSIFSSAKKNGDVILFCAWYADPLNKLVKEAIR